MWFFAGRTRSITRSTAESDSLKQNRTTYFALSDATDIDQLAFLGRRKSRARTK